MARAEISGARSGVEPGYPRDACSSPHGAERNAAQEQLAQQDREDDDRDQEERRTGGNCRPVLTALADDEWDEGWRGLRLARGQQHRKRVLVPGKDETKDRRRRNARRGLRQHHLAKGLKPGISVDHRRLFVLARYLVHET